MKAGFGDDRAPLHLLHRASQCADELFQAAMEGLDITPRQFMVLATLKRRGGLSQTSLVERTGIDRSTMTDVVRRLLSKGYVQRRRKRQDARTYSVTLTTKGYAHLERIKPIANEVDKRLLACLSQHNAQLLMRSLKYLVQTWSLGR